MTADRVHELGGDFLRMSQMPWKRAIVVGASSGMGEAVARRLAAGGVRVALVARRESELERVAESIRQAGGEALLFPHDTTRGEEAAGLFQEICRELGGLDLIVYAAGTMPPVLPDEYSFDKDRRVIEVNVLGAIAWLNEASNRFAKARGGTIVGISSVAGDRGRRGYPAYCASKAALNTYLESLRNRVGRFGVKVVTIKPGPVATPMTANLGKQPLMIPVGRAADAIVAAAAKGKHTAYVPGVWRIIMGIIRAIPSFLFKKMKL